MVPVNAKLHAREVEWIIDNAQARWAFVTRDVAPERLAGLAQQIDVEDWRREALSHDELFFKIYADREAFIALTGSCTSEESAWEQAAEEIRERDAAQAKKG